MAKDHRYKCSIDGMEYLKLVLSMVGQLSNTGKTGKLHISYTTHIPHFLVAPHILQYMYYVALRQFEGHGSTQWKNKPQIIFSELY